MGARGQTALVSWIIQAHWLCPYGGGMLPVPNVKQLSMGAAIYVQNHRGWYPVSGYSKSYNWTAVLAKELGLNYYCESLASPNFAPGQIIYSYKASTSLNPLFQCPFETGKFVNIWGGVNATSYRWNAGAFYGDGLGLQAHQDEYRELLLESATPGSVHREMGMIFAEPWRQLIRMAAAHMTTH